MWPQIWYSGAGYYYTVMVGAFGASLGHFWQFQSEFRAQSKRLGLFWSLFVTHLATQNDLNCPKSGTVGHVMTILYWWGPLGAILEYF